MSDTKQLFSILEAIKRATGYTVKNATNANIACFSSTHYVGLTEYHEQHAYDLFSFDRKDELETGPLFMGQKREAQQSYIQEIYDVLSSCKRFLADDYDIFLAASDKYNMYPAIAENTGMKIVNQFKHPVLNRTKKDKGAYSESVFHLKVNKCALQKSKHNLFLVILFLAIAKKRCNLLLIS